MLQGNETGTSRCFCTVALRCHIEIHMNISTIWTHWIDRSWPLHVPRLTSSKFLGLEAGTEDADRWGAPWPIHARCLWGPEKKTGLQPQRHDMTWFMNIHEIYDKPNLATSQWLGSEKPFLAGCGGESYEAKAESSGSGPRILGGTRMGSWCAMLRTTHINHIIYTQYTLLTVT